MDFIDNIEPYDGAGYHPPRYDLAGKYKTLTFKAYCDIDYTRTLYFWGDNDVLIDSFEIKGLDLPREYTVDLTGVQQLRIDNNGHFFLFDMSIE